MGMNNSKRIMVSEIKPGMELVDRDGLLWKVLDFLSGQKKAFVKMEAQFDTMRTCEAVQVKCLGMKSHVRLFAPDA